MATGPCYSRPLRDTEHIFREIPKVWTCSPLEAPDYPEQPILMFCHCESIRLIYYILYHVISWHLRFSYQVKLGWFVRSLVNFGPGEWLPVQLIKSIFAVQYRFGCSQQWRNAVHQLRASCWTFSGWTSVIEYLSPTQVIKTFNERLWNKITDSTMQFLVAETRPSISHSHSHQRRCSFTSCFQRPVILSLVHFV